MRIFSGLAKLFVAALMAGVLVAGLMLPYTVGLGLMANKVTEAIESANTSLLDMSKMPLRSTITDVDGNVLAHVYDQNREYVPLSDMTETLQKGVIAIEDRRFKKHHGVDWQGTVRALLQDAAGQQIQGGSTITQQLVKNYLYLVAASTPAEKADAIATTPVRKLREAKMALMYENTHTKNEILEQYLNLVAFGPSTYGAEAASQRFFGVHANRLSLTQSALLAAMINNPNTYNPLVPSQTAEVLERRNKVLDDMARDKYITDKTAAEAKKRSIAQDLNATSVPNGCLAAPGHATNGYFCRYVLDYLQNSGIKYEDIARGGYTITATMDPDAMKDAVDAVQSNASPDDEKAHRIANVMAIIEPGLSSRKVLALAANRPYGLDADKGETVQRLVTTFAPLGAGSIFKIFTVAAAMKDGLGVDSVVDVPKKYQSTLDPSYEPTNSGKFAKQMSLSQALAQSPNTPFVKLEEQVGLDDVIDMSVALGLKGYKLDAGDVSRSDAGKDMSYQEVLKNAEPPWASYTLGVTPVSPTELANVGATLDSDGMWCPPTPVASITDRNGRQVEWEQQNCEQAVSPELAHTLTNALTDDLSTKKGTSYKAGKAADWTRVTASKTGTTQKFRSSAFLGYTPYYAGAVVTWDYLTHPKPMCVDPVRSCSNKEAQGGAGMYGGTIPAKTWLDAMKPLHSGEPNTPFPVSDPKYLAGGQDSQVPDVTNMQLSDAITQLAAHGFTDVTKEYSDETTSPVNTVIAQDPTGTALPGSTITLTISIGQGNGATGPSVGESDDTGSGDGNTFQGVGGGDG